MKKLSLTDLFLSLFFALVLLLPLFFLRLTGAEVSEQEKRMLADYPKLYRADGSLNHAVKNEAQSWLEDHIGFRSRFIKLAASTQFFVFRRSSSESVHLGSEGWMYYTLDNNLQIATGDYPLTQQTLEQILQNHLAIRDKLSARGVEYLVILPCSKVSIYPEHLRCGDRQPHVTPVDLVADYLEQNSDLRVVRLKDTLLQEKDRQQVYFKTDTHWTYGGAYAGYLEIIRRMQGWGLCDTEPVEVSWYPYVNRGQIVDMRGVDLPAEATSFSRISLPQAVRDGDQARDAIYREALEAEGIYTPCYYYRNDSVEGKRLMIYGDSMFALWNMTELLAEHFPELTFVWDRSIRPRLLEDLQPDIVMYELTERYLNQFPGLNEDFLAS